MSEVETDYCIHGCYYMDTPEECLLDAKDIPDCKRAKDEEKAKAFAFLQAQAAKSGKTIEQWLEEDLRPILEKAWEIQQRTGKPVSISELVEP